MIRIRANKKPHRSEVNQKRRRRSGGDIQSPTLVSGNSLFASRHSGITSGAADVEGLSAGHGGQASKQFYKIGAGESSRDHVDAAASHAGVIGNTQGGDDLLDRRGDLTANDVAIGLVRHDK